jgi:hypothetical protein
MMRLHAALLAAGLFLLPAAVPAQVTLGAAAGPSFPVGRLADRVEPGFHGGLVLQAGLPLLPVGIRADLMLQQLPGTAGGDGFSQFYGTLNGRVGLLPIPLVSLYATAGVGLYSSTYAADRAADAETGRRTDTGINGGVGARLNLLVVRPFVEARYHRVPGEPARGFLPVTVGIWF